MDKVFKWIDHNRFLVVLPIVGLVIWTIAAGCTPATVSPIDPARQVTAAELELDFLKWKSETEFIAARFDFARADLQEQTEQLADLQAKMITLASGGVADLPGLFKLLMSGAGIGAITDNIRKRGLISGLKRNAAQ